MVVGHLVQIAAELLVKQDVLGVLELVTELVQEDVKPLVEEIVALIALADAAVVPELAGQGALEVVVLTAHQVALLALDAQDVQAVVKTAVLEHAAQLVLVAEDVVRLVENLVVEDAIVYALLALMLVVQLVLVDVTANAPQHVAAVKVVQEHALLLVKDAELVAVETAMDA